MKYALVLESSIETCNDTSAVLASLGYLITPAFSPKRALHAAHMIHFDLIVTWTDHLPGDRRSLSSELARCSPEAILILLADPYQEQLTGHHLGVSAILQRPLTSQQVKAVVEQGRRGPGIQPLPPQFTHERRRRAVE